MSIRVAGETTQNRLAIVGLGDIVFVPRGTPHALKVLSGPAHLITVHNPAGQERFFRAAGQRAETATLPGRHRDHPTPPWS